jgi:hypothetical protein
VMIVVMMIIVVVIVLLAMGVHVMGMHVVVMGVMFVAMAMLIMLVIVMMIVVVGLVLVVVLRVGVHVLAVVQRSLAVVRRQFTLGCQGRGICACLETFDDVALHPFAMAAAAGIAVAGAPAAVGAVLALLFGLAMGLFLGLDQRLPVGDGDLVVVGMDFAERQEAVAVAAIFDESGLERGFDPGDLGEINVPAQLLALRGLEIKLFDTIAADHDDPGLFRVGGIDQHLVGHVLTLGSGGRDSA